MCDLTLYARAGYDENEVMICQGNTLTKVYQDLIV